MTAESAETICWIGKSVPKAVHMLLMVVSTMCSFE